MHVEAAQLLGAFRLLPVGLQRRHALHAKAAKTHQQGPKVALKVASSMWLSFGGGAGMT